LILKNNCLFLRIVIGGLMAKYVKLPTIVEAFASGKEQNLGTLGALTTDDMIIRLAAGDLCTMTDTSFYLKYQETNDSATLTGEDWN
jgi:hypothetical protein